jgi:hypothetical protein
MNNIVLCFHNNYGKSIVSTLFNNALLLTERYKVVLENCSLLPTRIVHGKTIVSSGRREVEAKPQTNCRIVRLLLLI